MNSRVPTEINPCLTRALLGGASLSTLRARLALVGLLGIGLATSFPAHAANFNVGTEAQLRNAIGNAQNGDTITFTANITLSENLPHVHRSVAINGGNFTLSGNNKHRGFVVNEGSVAISNLTIAHTIAQGGNGGTGSGDETAHLAPGLGGGGGGGAGLGGALFIASGATVAVANVNMIDNQARGGNGSGAWANNSIWQLKTNGGGGGMFTNGEDGGTTLDGKGGDGGGGCGECNGTFGGGGGGGGPNKKAGDGGFGGGGGGAGYARAATGTYYYGTPGRGGFGGGDGGGMMGGGGGGMGGAIFVQQGGTLNLVGSLKMSGGSVAGGASKDGGQNGQAFGAGMFLQGNGSLSVNPGVGQTQTISDAIVDQTGVAGSGGSWSLVKNGAGTTILTGANAYSGGTTVNAGVLQGNTAGLRGNIINNASVVFDQTATGTYSGIMSGSGTMTKIGAGDLLLTGNNSYAGGTTVNGGALLVKSDAALGGAGTAVRLNNGGIIGIATDAVASSNRPVTITGSGGFRAENRNSMLTWSGVIGGNGTLVTSGNGTVILSGANTYSGGTKVTGGVLRVDSDANLGAAGPGITLSNGGAIGSTKDTPAARSFERNITLVDKGGIHVALHPITWSGNITGAGQLIVHGPGELELTGTNTYSGGTRLSGGTLRIASNDKLGAAASGIVFDGGSLRASESFTSNRAAGFELGGAFLVDAGKTLTWNGVVSGRGHITKVGAGTLILSGANTYTGDLYHNGGTVQGNTTSLRGNIRFDPNADNPIARSVTFDQATNGTFAGTITNKGSITKIGAGTLTLTGNNDYSGGTTVSAGTLRGASNSLQGNILNNAAVIFDQARDGTYAGVMSGSGTFTKQGAGKLMLPGIQAFTGATNINAGNLNVNGSLESSSMVNVNVGGTLSGNGKFGNVNNNGGTISPGNSIGTIVINGNLNMGPASKYLVEINGVASDRIEVSGTANIQSSVFEIAHDSDKSSAPILPGTTYTLITAQGGLTTTAPQVAVADFPFLDFTLNNDGFNGTLTTSRNAAAFDTLASTPNEKVVAGALDAAGIASPLWQQIVGATEAQARTAFISLGNASIHASAKGMLLEDSRFVRDAASDRIRSALDGIGAARAPVLAYGDDGAELVAADTDRFAVWGNAFGSWGDNDSDGNAAALDRSIGGLLLGGDALVGDTWRAGLMTGFSRSSFHVDGSASSGDATSYYLGAYAGSRWGALSLRMGAAYGWNSIETRRAVAVASLSETLSADYDAGTAQIFGEGGYRIDTAAASFEPFANLAYVNVHTDAFTERGGAAAISQAGSNTDATFATLGIRASGDFALGEINVVARGMLGWRHAFGDVTPLSTLAFAGSNAFTVSGVPIARDAAVLEAGLDFDIAPKAKLGVSYTGQFGSGVSDNGAKLDLSVRF